MPIPAPVFILASPHSFTSVVCAMVGNHPETYGVPELNLLLTDTLAELVEMASGKQMVLLHGLLRTVAQLYAGEQTMESIQMAHRWIKRRLAQPSFLVYQELCQKIAPLRVIDKSLDYAKDLTVLNRIRDTFPEARFLYLVRHPREQGESMMKELKGVATLIATDSLDYNTEPPVVDPQIAWFCRQSNILAFLDTLPAHQVMAMRGEDLCSDPHSYLEQLCAWLNLSWNEAVYEQMLRTQDSPYACMGPFGAQWGNNLGFQKSPAFRQFSGKPAPLAGSLPWRRDQQELKPEVMALARALGYE